MPTYEYDCPGCGLEDERKLPMTECGARQHCDGCGHVLVKVFRTVPMMLCERAVDYPHRALWHRSGHVLSQRDRDEKLRESGCEIGDDPLQKAQEGGFFDPDGREEYLDTQQPDPDVEGGGTEPFEEED